MKLRKCKACISRVKSRTGGDFRPTGAIFCLTLSILCLIHGEHSVTTASSSVHPSLTRAATRPLLEPTTVLPRPCPPQPTAYTGGATKAGRPRGASTPPFCCNHMLPAGFRHGQAPYSTHWHGGRQRQRPHRCPRTAAPRAAGRTTDRRHCISTDRMTPASPPPLRGDGVRRRRCGTSGHPGGRQGPPAGAQ